jgi:hypothetical protein
LSQPLSFLECFNVGSGPNTYGTIHEKFTVEDVQFGLDGVVHEIASANPGRLLL